MARRDVPQGRRSALKPGLAARAAALALISAVLDEGRMLSAVIEAEDGPLAPLAPSERARAQRLATVTLRHLERADAVLKPFLRKPPPVPARHVLRLATVEICAMDGQPHAVVDAAASLLRGQGGPGQGAGPRLAGLANAVLRKVAVEGPARWTGLPAPRLPGWLRGRLSSAWGSAAVGRIEAVQAGAPPLDLTPRDPADPADLADLAEALEAELLPTGSLRLTGGAQVSALPGYEDGQWWVQDAAAALPAKLLAAQPGERALDLCAAPGGKTLQLAATGAEVTALDISAPRLERLRANLERTGLSAAVIAADVLHWVGGPFDAVLLDAPCSATGTIRRHPDLPFVRTVADLAPLVALQEAMLDRAADLLRPGGRLVYCTCSLLPQEGEAQIDALLARRGDLAAAPEMLEAEWIEPEWRSAQGLRLRPDFWAARGGMDGFFIAALRRA